MLISTLLASWLPQWASFSPQKLARISTYSVGLLLGAALVVVIPEGVSAVYSSSLQDGDAHGDNDEHGHGHAAHENAGWIGIALLSGFILMYVIDSMDAQDPPTPPSRTIRNCACLYRSSSAASELEPLTRDDSSRSQSSHRDSDSYEWEENGYTTSPDCPPHSRSTNESHSSTSSALSTVAGLLVHSIADGISLGASSLSSPSPSSSPVNGDTSLDFIIFLAIMVHKAPAAFALSALLSTTPATTPTFVRHSLLAFSFAAPLGALLTYFLLTLVGAESGAGVGWWTGIALVFSGGTFLFVATHVMKGKDGDEADVTGTGKRGKMGLVIGGMVTPLILSKLVGHGH